MHKSFKGLYGRAAGFTAEVGWATAKEKDKNQLGMAKPGLCHLMLYLHNRLCWDRNLDVKALFNEYYELYFGPAKTEMKEFHEFAEEVWMRPESRSITVAGGFLKKKDVEKFFTLLDQAKKKTGDTIYGRRIAYLAAEMEPLKKVHDKLERTGPKIRAWYAPVKPKIDGDLEKEFWTKTEIATQHTYFTLKDMVTGLSPKHVSTRVSFRWLRDNTALVVGIKCFEPKMDKLNEGCKERDSMAIFSDDNIEIQIETQEGIRPKIVINSAGTIFDFCKTKNVADLESFYEVKKFAVKKHADYWTVEALIEAKTISGTKPTPFFPWGINICRQRMAGNSPEYYMLSPSGTSFKDLKCMGNLYLRK
ncbi:MAG: sugar-binding protein [Planctomycetota bacterium]|jgi:hypothetical protein